MAAGGAKVQIGDEKTSATNGRARIVAPKLRNLAGRRPAGLNSSRFETRLQYLAGSKARRGGAVSPPCQ
jgi:hypothetical protein